MTENAKVSEVHCITFIRRLKGPIKRVWEHISDPTKVPGWFGDDGLIEPKSGGKVSLMSGHIRGVVTQWQPPKKLTYTWNVFEPDDPADAISDYPEFYPCFELEEEGEGVRLTFTHQPVPERFVSQTCMGWHTMLDMIEAALAGETVPDRAALMEENAKRYHVDLNNLAS
jgi:uncharacterized protein YndB with AHSA1/START domain